MTRELNTSTEEIDIVIDQLNFGQVYFHIYINKKYFNFIPFKIKIDWKEVKLLKLLEVKKNLIHIQKLSKH